MKELRAQARDAATSALESARARETICTPRGSHRPVMLKRFTVGDRPYRFRLCGDCNTWVDPSPINAQDTVRP